MQYDESYKWTSTEEPELPDFPIEDLDITEEKIIKATEQENIAVEPKGDIGINAKYILIDTTPDSDIDFQNSYMSDSWLDAYTRMINLILSISKGDLEEYLSNGKAVIGIYSAQTVDCVKGIRHVYHIIPYVV